MTTTTPNPTTRSRRGLWIAAGVVAVILIGGLTVGGLALWWLSAHDMTGLAGTWRDPANPKFQYEFRADGRVDSWNGSRSLVNKLGWEATWRRSGNHITIRTDRNWDFEGDLEGDTIRGRMLMRDTSGAIVPTAEMVWKRE